MVDNVNPINTENEDISAPKAKIFWAAISILIILLMLSLSFISSTVYKFSGIDENAVSLKTNMDEKLEVFSISYKNSTGQVTVSGTNGEKVVAPGTGVEYTVRIRNTDKIAIDYELVPEVAFTSEHKLPIVVRLIDPYEQYIAGDATRWASPEELSSVVDKGTLKRAQSAEYTFQWEWPFESGDDAYDTFLGDLAAEEDVTLTISFALNAVANTTLDANDNFAGEETVELSIFLLFAVLLIVALALLLKHKLNNSAFFKSLNDDSDGENSAE